MALSGAVAHGAAAPGAGKKAAQVQLQAELNTDDDFAHFLQRDGLLVVDVYTEWCGPCLGMVGNLKKIKVELGGDNMHLAVAKSDTIECLKRFRNRSEPTWMFLAGGQLLNVVFGADAPRIARTIEQELQNEELVRRGERQRVQRAPHELTPHEQEAADAEARAAAARREREAAAAAEARLARREARARSLEQHFGDACPALLLPHAQKHLRKVTDALEPFGVIVADKCPLVVGRDTARVLAVEEGELGTTEAAAALAERPSLALLLKKLPDREGDVIELSRRALFGDGVESSEEPPRRYLSEDLRAGDVPGVFVPVDRHQRAAALDLLFPKMVSAVSPAPGPPTPPHVAVVCGAWQRRAALAAAGAQLLCYGFFADAGLDQPRLLCKTLEQYEDRPEKNYSETLVMMLAVGAAEPALTEGGAVPPSEPPERLLALGPLHVSADAVAGAAECARFFPPGYTEPEHKPKPKSRKKKKKRHETKDLDEGPEAANGTTEENDAEASGDADGGDGADGADGDEAEGGADEAEGGVDEAEGGVDEAEGEADEAEGGVDEAEGGADEANGAEGADACADKATSPPP